MKCLREHKEFIGTYGVCVNCGSEVLDFTCNYDFYILRDDPEKGLACEWDWWLLCENVDCINHYGEGVWQDTPEWVIIGGVHNEI